jgi:hypothetical protein
MLMRKRYQWGLLTLCSLLCTSSLYAQAAQTLTIYTHFKEIVGNPSWLLVLRDMNSGEVLPYLFDIKHEDNFWLAFSKEHAYRVTASVLKFPPYATINNFCGLQDGVLKGKSMYITLKGTISPDPRTSKCYVTKVNQAQFTIVKSPQ